MSTMNYKFRFPFLIVLLAFSLSVNAQKQFDYIDSTGDYNLDRITSYIEKKFNADDSPESKKELKFYNRWKNHVQGRLDENGNLTNYAARNHLEMKKFLKSRDAATVQTENGRNVHGEWTNVTPGDYNLTRPSNGRVTCVTIHPNNPNVIYIGTPVGGLWASYSGGTSWVNLNPGMDNLGVSGIAINYNATNTMYMLTGEGDGRDSPSMGVFKSENGGFDWEPTGLFWTDSQLYYGYKLIMHPSNPNIMFIVTNRGVFRTTDGWNTWTQKLTGMEMRDIEFVTGAPDTLYACSKTKVYKSTNAGASWESLTAPGLTSSTNWDRVALATSPDLANYLYIIYARNLPAPDTNWGYHELYLTSNYGSSFTMKSSEFDIVSDQSHYNLNLLVEPSVPWNVYLGAVNLWKSEDYGNSFDRIAVGEDLPDIHADCHGLEWDNGTLYTATDGGISKSTDGGSTFTNISDGLTIMEFYDIDVKGTELMGGTQDNGTNQWTLGDPQAVFIQGGDGLECMFDPTENGRYVSTQNNRYRCFPNDTVCWQKITHPSQEDDIWQGSWNMHPTDYDTIYSAVRTLARSYDRGSTWQIFDPGFNMSARIEAMAQGVDNPNRMYLSDRNLIRRTSSLHSNPPGWITVSDSLPLGGGVKVGEITVDPEDADRVWVTLLGYNEDEKVYYSSTGGLGVDPWENITENLPNVPVYTIEYLPGSNDGLYVGTDFGVFYKDASMTNWAWFSNSLPKTRIEDMVLTDNYIYAGTYGRGIWRSPHFGTCPVASLLTPANDPSPSYSTGTQAHSASFSIVSTRILSGGFGTHVKYSAGNYVRLDPGFHAKSQNELIVVLDGCPN